MFEKSPVRAALARAIKQRWVEKARPGGMSHGSYFHTDLERMRMQYYIAHRILRRADFGIDHPDNAKYLHNEMGLTQPYFDEVARSPLKIEERK